MVRPSEPAVGKEWTVATFSRVPLASVGLFAGVIAKVKTDEGA